MSDLEHAPGRRRGLFLWGLWLLLAGAPSGDATSWVGNRLLDTIVGCAVALIATYLLWPRDRVTEEAPVPAPTT